MQFALFNEGGIHKDIQDMEEQQKTCTVVEKELLVLVTRLEMWEHKSHTELTEREHLTSLSEINKTLSERDWQLTDGFSRRLSSALTTLIGNPGLSRYIPYTTARCIISLVKILQRDSFHSLCSELTVIVTLESTPDVVSSQIIDIFKHVYKESSTDAQYAKQTDHLHDKFLANLTKDSFLIPDKSKISPYKLHSLISLWNNIMKYQNMFLKPDERFLLPPLPQTLSLLMDNSLPAFSVKKILSLFVNCLDLRDTSRSKELCSGLETSGIVALFDAIPMCDREQGFGGCAPSPSEQIHDVRCVRKLTILVVKCVAASIAWEQSEEEIQVHLNLLYGLNVKLNSIIRQEKVVFHWSIHLFIEQDDQMIHVLHNLLKIYILAEIKSGVGSKIKEEVGDEAVLERLKTDFDPIILFLHFLRHTLWDNSLLLDLLISPETDFLSYFVEILKHIRQQWNTFVADCNDFSKQNIEEFEELSGEESETPSPPSSGKRLKLTEYSDDSNSSIETSEETNDIAVLASLDILKSSTEKSHSSRNPTIERTLTLLIRLNLSIKRLDAKSLFPYNPKPLIILLDDMEGMFDNMT